MPDLGIGEALLTAAATGAGELGAGTAAAAAPAALTTAAETAVPAALTGAAETAATTAAPALDATGLSVLGAGAGEAGSVATGLGTTGVSTLGDTAGLGSVLGTGAAAGIPTASTLDTAGLSLGTGFEALGDTAIPTTATLTAGNAADLGLGSVTNAATGGAGTDLAMTVPTIADSTASLGGESTGLGGLAGGIGDWLSKNSLTLGLGGAGIGASLYANKIGNLFGTNKVPQESTLTTAATNAGNVATTDIAKATELIEPLTTGKLPADAEQSVQNALNDSQASIRSKYAQLGLTGSTMELEALNAAKNQAEANRFTIAKDMATTGVTIGNQALTAMNLQDSIYTSLMNAQISQDTALQTAISKVTGSIGQGAALGTAINAAKS